MINPLHILAGSTGLAVGGVLLFVINLFVTKIEEAKVYEIAAMQAQIALTYQQNTAKMSQDFSDELGSRALEISQLKSEHQNEINSLRSVIDGQAIAEPFNTGNDFERRLALIMCKIASGGDKDSRQACSVRSTAPYSPDRSIVITVTANTAEDWRILCDEGQRDYCDYAVIGFTSQGALTVLSWLQEVDAYQAMLNAYIDGQQDIQKQLTE